MVNQNIIKIIKTYINELTTKGLLIKKVYLFGSHIKGTASKKSDIDLLLISPQFDINNDSYASIIWLSDFRTENKIEPITIGEKRFNEDDASPLLEVVRQEGVEIIL